MGCGASAPDYAAHARGNARRDVRRAPGAANKASPDSTHAPPVEAPRRPSPQDVAKTPVAAPSKADEQIQAARAGELRLDSPENVLVSGGSSFTSFSWDSSSLNNGSSQRKRPLRGLHRQGVPVAAMKPEDAVESSTHKNTRERFVLTPSPNDALLHNNNLACFNASDSPHAALSSPTKEDASSNGFATFCNQPKECYCCRSSAVAYECEDCSPERYLCEQCFFASGLDGLHDEHHVIVPLQEVHCNTSRTFGGASYSTAEAGGSSILYKPCSLCERTIDDMERVHRCEQCDFIVCSGCFNSTVTHEHELRSFQRRSRSGSTQECAVMNKSRTEEGNRIINHYVVVGPLGQGSFAKVKLVQNIKTRELFALKILHRQKKQNPILNYRSRSGSSEGDLLREIAVMKVVDHPNIVRLQEVIDDVEANKVYIIMEYCEKGPIYQSGGPPLSVDLVRRYGSDILRGLLHLHSEFLYHRDVKPANCLVNATGVVKLADFGTCNSLVRTNLSEGTPAFSSPEQLRGQSVSGEVVDSWAFAVTLFEIAYGRMPFPANTQFELRDALLGPAPLVLPGEGEGGAGCDCPQLRDLLARMLTKDGGQRLLLQSVAAHPFFHLNAEEVGNALPPGVSHAIQQHLMNHSLSVVRRGKNLNACFYGVQAIRRMRRKELMTAQAGARDTHDEEDNESRTTGVGASPTASPERDGGRQPSAEDDEFMMAEVRDKIAQQKSSRGAKLELVRTCFTAPPTCVNEVAVQTKSLCFSHNRLSSVGTILFANFLFLTDIAITSNGLTSFPVEVLQAPRLLRLDLANNKIDAVPHVLNTANFLQRINLHGNCLTSLGVDPSGRSVLAGRGLRHARLSSNRLQQIPEALETTHRLELVLDASPALMTGWAAVIKAAQPAPPPAVVIWDDYFPVHVLKTRLPVWLANGNLALYRVTTLMDCEVRHVVLFQLADRRFPTGAFTAADLGVYFTTLASKMGRYVNERQQQQQQQQPTVLVSSPSESPQWQAERNSATAEASLRSLPPIVNKASRAFVKSFFFASDQEDDAEGGYLPLHAYIQSHLAANEAILFCMMSSTPAANHVRESVIAVLSDVLEKLSGPAVQLSEQIQTVVEALHGMYS